MKRFYTETSPCIRRDCSVRSFCCCVVCRVTIGFEHFNSLCTITRQPSHFWILPSAKLAVQVAGYYNRKRSQNNFRLHFTSKTPYSFDTRGILSTPAFDVHVRLKTTTRPQAISQEILRTIKTRNLSQWHISKDNNFYSRRHVLRVRCLWKSWAMKKSLQIYA